MYFRYTNLQANIKKFMTYLNEQDFSSTIIEFLSVHLIKNDALLTKIQRILKYFNSHTALLCLPIDGNRPGIYMKSFALVITVMKTSNNKNFVRSQTKQTEFMEKQTVQFLNKYLKFASKLVGRFIRVVRTPLKLLS